MMIVHGVLNIVEEIKVCPSSDGGTTRTCQLRLNLMEEYFVTPLHLY